MGSLADPELVHRMPASRLIHSLSSRRTPMCAMSRTLLLLVSVVVGAFAADGMEKPWTDEWSMTLKGSERWYVEHNERNYLEVIPADLDGLDFLVGKDVMIQSKFKQLEGTTVQFYNFPTLVVGADSESWSTIIEGDNVYVLGKVVKLDERRLKFKTDAVLRAPSDSAIIASKLSEIDENDHDARIAFARWVRKEGNNMGNRAVWMTAAENIADNSVRAISKQAKDQRNVVLLLKAMTWCTDELSDKSRAAKLGSQEWVGELSEEKTKAIIDRMSILGLVKHEGKWMTKREQKIADFHKKLRSIAPDNAEGFFALANDIAQYRDALPEAIELQHHALQVGLRHNPSSNILRKALGKKSVEEEREAEGVLAAFTDTQTSLSVAVPAGWQRSPEIIDGDVTWIDPSSTTAYISLVLIRGAKSANFAELFAKQLEPYQGKQGYEEKNATSLGLASASREARFTMKEGREQREGILSCLLFIEADTAYVVYASFLDKEAAQVEKAYKHILTQIDETGGKRLESQDEGFEQPVEESEVEPVDPGEELPVGDDIKN